MASTYAYKVRDDDGRFKEGTVSADNEKAVAEKLIAMGYVPLEVKEMGKGLNREISFGTPRVKTKDLAVFARQLATMVDAGLSLLRGLTILHDQTEHAGLKIALGNLKQAVESGHSLSSALAADPATYPPFMIHMTRAGEAGGFLDGALKQIAETFEADVKLRGKVKSAMTYPVVVLIMALLMCVGMLLFIVPIFEKMFEDLGGELPLPTQVLVTLSNSMKFVLPVCAVAMVAGVAWWRKNGRKESVRRVVDPLKMKLPVFGDLFAKIALARFARNLSTLLGAGVPVLQSLEIVAETSGSTVIADALFDVRASVSQGEAMAAPLARHKIFPGMTVQMISSGEESGSVDQMLGRIAKFYDEEVEATTDALTSLIEPLMIAFLGVVVGGMIIALYMPMFSVFDLIK